MSLPISSFPPMGKASLVTPTNTAALTMGTNITAATADGALTDSSATNPTEAQFNELAKELGAKINQNRVDIAAIITALQNAGLMSTS